MAKQKNYKKRIKDIETKKNYSGEASPYWDWMKEHQRTEDDGQPREDVFANPDVLSEDEHMFHRPLTKEGELQFQVIRDTVPSLSPQQRQVLQLCGFDGLTQVEAAKELGISVSTVHELLGRAREKIQRNFKRAKAKDSLKD